jgi:hypothetical protein
MAGCLQNDWGGDRVVPDMPGITDTLPPKSVFEPPSYPNVWFYVHENVAGSQADAVAFVVGWLRDRCGIVDDFRHFKPPEASDSQARLGRLQPWHDAADDTLHHAHDLHIRYYYVALRQTGQDRAALDASHAASGDAYYRFAGSVHYEVEDEHPLHPYIDECPLCGRMGSYAGATDLFAGAHEPLGLELLLYGTVRGLPVRRATGEPVGGLIAMRESHRVDIFPGTPTRPDMNIVALAVVAIGPRGPSRGG